jgi:hypothetical protein
VCGPGRASSSSSGARERSASTGSCSPSQYGLHEAVVTGPFAPDPDEIAWHDWLTEPQLAELVRDEAFVPDAREAYHRWTARRREGTPPEGPTG